MKDFVGTNNFLNAVAARVLGVLGEYTGVAFAGSIVWSI